MRKSSKEGKNRYLLLLVFIGFIIVPALSGSLHAKDSAIFQEKDTVKAQKKDTAGVQAKDTTKAQVKDTSKLQVKDTTKIKGKDSTSLQAKDTVKQQLPDSIIYKKATFTAEELILGERLFNGLVYLGDKSVNCASCHNTSVSDTLNWNPDALEISKKYLHMNAKDLSKVLLKPIGPKMKIVHKDFKLTASDIVLLKAYMDKFVNIGLKPEKPVITYILLLIIASLLFISSAVDVIIKKIYKDRRINWAILTVTGIFITWILAVDAIAFGRAKGFAPAQPIKFSHKVHAGQNKTDCNYCHYTARTSKTAGIPSGSICYNCHFLVRNGTRSGATEIAKILAHLDEKKPVDWIRIYKLPDFVFFSHEQHVSAGGITCDACHGNVKEMDRLYQFPDLSMGWCIDCHKTRKVNISNGYYKTYYPNLYDSLKAGKVDSIRVVGIGGRDCGKCHY